MYGCCKQAIMASLDVLLLYLLGLMKTTGLRKSKTVQVQSIWPL